MTEASNPIVWKMIYLARRNPALAAADFPQAWREHSALGRQCVNVGQRVKAVAQCSRVLDAEQKPLSLEYDGVNLMVLADRESGQAIWSDPETLAIMRPDEPRVFDDYVRNFSMLCQQHVLRGSKDAAEYAQCDGVILQGFLQRGEAFAGAAHAPVSLPLQWTALGLNAAHRIVCNTLDEVAPVGYGFRYIVEWWFASVKEAQAALFGLEDVMKMAPEQGEHAWGDAVFVLTQVTHSRP